MLSKKGPLNSKQPYTNSIPVLYVELRCERAFIESYMAVSLFEATKFACEWLEFLRPLYVISNGVKNC